MSNDTASFAAVLGCLGPRVGDPHTLTPANKEIAKTPPGTSAIDVEVPGGAEALRGVCSLMCASRKKTRSVSGIGPKSRDSHQSLVGR